MASQQEALNKLRAHTRKASSDTRNPETGEDELEHYANRLAKSLQSLQNQVKQSEKALEQVFKVKSSEQGCEDLS